MTRAATIRFLLYGLAVSVSAATLFWVSSWLSVVSFGWPANPWWRNWLNIFLLCLLPSIVSLVLVGKSLLAAHRSKYVIAFVLLAGPVVVMGLLLSAIYWRWVF